MEGKLTIDQAHKIENKLDGKTLPLNIETIIKELKEVGLIYD